MIWCIGYAFACVLIPLAWGLLVYRFSSKLEKLIGQKQPRLDDKATKTDVVPDYHI